jgi:hypothetical protein
MAGKVVKNKSELIGMLKKLSLSRKKTVTVGFMEGDTYPNGTPVAAVAAWNEFGHGGRFPSPPRPFFRNAINKNQKRWAREAAGFLSKNLEPEKAAALLGEVIKGDIYDSIVALDSPPLSPVTLALRSDFWSNPQEITMTDVFNAQRKVKNGDEVASGSQAKPLVWTGHLLRSISYNVK